MVGAGMISRGEMALIILQIGQQSQLIEPQYYSPLVIVILLSTLISPLVLKYFTKKVYEVWVTQKVVVNLSFIRKKDCDDTVTVLLL